mmetsp:Transcript_37260/g.54866  ORF Transcript_37260/g.54866 Transcript_37260/m.54866 type:complete len:89 (+) Transcript_37260:161-427(+)
MEGTIARKLAKHKKCKFEEGKNQQSKFGYRYQRYVCVSKGCVKKTMWYCPVCVKRNRSRFWLCDECDDKHMKVVSEKYREECRMVISV